MTNGLPLPHLQAHPEKYAHVERERRYLLSRLPPGLTAQSEHRRVFDRYLTGTWIRLRRVYRPSTGESLWKLTQKLRSSSGGAPSVLTTTMYLLEQEYSLFLGMPGRDVRKDRFLFHHNGRLYAVDVFHDALSGLILAETECGSDEELSALSPPDFAVLDVSHDKAFTGGALAVLTSSGARLLLAAVNAGVNPLP